MNSLASAGRRVAIVMIAAGLLAGSVTLRDDTSGAFSAPTAPMDRPRAGVVAPVPAPLTDPALSLRSGPVDVPIQLLLPSLGLRAPVIGVGMLPNNTMDAPMGPAESPVWQQGFWYRGSAVPGEPSSALIAGHISDPLGRPGVFARIGELRPGDPVVVHDIRTGLDVRFAVTDATSYPIEQTSDPAVLEAIYGEGPVTGRWAVPSANGRAYLTLVTCDGTFRNGTHDRRLVVHATRMV